MNEADGILKQQAAALAASAGLGGAIRLEPMRGGRNNRVFLLHARGARAVLKAYFRHPDDPRDRMGAEAAFLNHAASQNLECVPRLLAVDRPAGLSLLSFVEGRRLEPGEIGRPQVDAALEFFLLLNQGSPDLPEASESCFSLQQHLACVERRIARLVLAAANGSLRPDAAAFVAEELGPAWSMLLEEILGSAPRILGAHWDAPLAPELRRVSPSDFGFHNALLRPDGTLVFLDFEYAGLDDPAKMSCDFFCQPEVPVPLSLLPLVLERLALASPLDAGLGARVGMLLPAYKLKWCCIMLNEFLPLGAARRNFAATQSDEARREAVRDGQLALARATLHDHRATR
ncbi:MAG: aminoglycoside phosphotransferase family protein [Proteobacteria bacterium]|nr:aminoglycoside phosphotransferase family protein [Pseudomonadota bacterium]